MRKNYSGELGITLLETVLAATVALIVGTLLLNILVSQSGIFYKQRAEVEVGLGLNEATSEVDRVIRQSIQVVSGYPEVSPDYTTSSSTLVLKLPATTPTGILDNYFDYAVVTIDPQNPKILRLKVFPDPGSARASSDLVLTTQLASVSFNYLDKSGMAVSPVAAYQVAATITLLSAGSVNLQRSVSVQTTLRNNSL